MTAVVVEKGVSMKFLFLGDIVGRAGRQVVLEHVPMLRQTQKLDFVVANGENAAGGFGINASIFQDLREAGVDVVTLGNHAFDQREVVDMLPWEERLIRPINYPEGTPGRGATLIEHDGFQTLVINVMGRLFMDPLDDPFKAVDQALAGLNLGQDVDAIIVDVHAEATSEKMAMGHWLDGRVSLVVGSHTHVPTADARILPQGTAYLTDAGMCGDYDSVIGMEKTEPLQRFITKRSQGRFQPAAGPGTLCGVLVEVGSDGLAKLVKPIRIGAHLHNT